MISGRVEVHLFAYIRLRLGDNFGDNPEASRSVPESDQ